MVIKNEILSLLENGKITKAIKIFVEYVKENREELYEKSLDLMEQNRINRNDKTLDRISLEDYNTKTNFLEEQLKDLIKDAQDERREIIELDDVMIPKKIFICYHQSSTKIAVQLKETLANNGALDILELNITNGEDVSSIIAEKVNEADVTLSIIANKPIESAWLALETVKVFYDKKSVSKNFIVLYLDSDFFDWRYQMEGAGKLVKRIKELDNDMSEGLNLEDDFLKLDKEKKRLISLRDNLDDILKNLKKSPIFDIRGDKMKRNLPKLIKSIRC